MSKKTPMMIPPSMAEVKLAAAKIGLPEIEAEKFYYYFSSNGWHVGKNRMVSFVAALSHWKLVWMERRSANGNGHGNGVVQKSWAARQADRMYREEFGCNT